jgi:hypothetical protein
MVALARYFARLNTGRMILWCYAVWYAVNVYNHFDPRPRLWLTSLGLSGIIGAALYISMRSSSKGTTQLDRWQVFRLFLMPFCVSSFSALVKDAGYILVFPPSWRENLAGILLIALFVAAITLLRSTTLAKPVAQTSKSAAAPAAPPANQGRIAE